MERGVTYLQIDFLRLFRLSRQLKYVNKKRAMPPAYHDTNEAVNCCKRLLKSFLSKVFPSDLCTIKTSGSDFKIILKREYIDLFIFFNRYAWKKSEKDLEDKFRILNAHSPSLRPSLTSSGYYSTNVHVSTTSFHHYYRYGGYTTSRTPHRFYDAALEVLEYKKVWDEVIPTLLKIRGDV